MYNSINHRWKYALYKILAVWASFHSQLLIPYRQVHYIVKVQLNCIITIIWNSNNTCNNNDNDNGNDSNHNDK